MRRASLAWGWWAPLLLAEHNVAARATLERRAEKGALSVPVSQAWNGNDGDWSTFVLSMGTPSQTINVLASNTQPMPWAIDAEYGCKDNATATCANDRGGLYANSTSSSWSFEGLHQLIDPQKSQEGWLGYAANGYMGNETVSLGWRGSTVATARNQMIASTPGGSSKSFYLGYLGLFPRPLNLTNWDYVTPSLLENLQKQGDIPSLSWGYTAGARSNVPEIYASLTLGGYDETRLSPSQMAVGFDTDQSRDLLVWVNGIRTGSLVSNSNGTKTLLEKKDRFQAAIDFTFPYFWLPEAVCANFEAAFGLKWDRTSQLYLLSEQQHEALKAADPTVMFTLGGDGASEISISMPYSQFDLVAKSPLVNSDTRYFPLKRAQYSNQTILGRAFMQSAYVTADYGRSSFTIGQALYPSAGFTSKLVTILPPGKNKSGSSLSTGTLVGTIVGAIGGVLLVAAIIFFTCRKKRTRIAEAKAAAAAESADPFAHKPELEANEVTHNPTKGKHEVDGIDSGINEVDGHAMVYPELMEGKAKAHELPHEHLVYEMPAEDVTLPELESPATTQAGSTPVMGRMLSNIQERPGEEGTLEKPPLPPDEPRRKRFSYEPGDD